MPLEYLVRVADELPYPCESLEAAEAYKVEQVNRYVALTGVAPTVTVRSRHRDGPSDQVPLMRFALVLVGLLLLAPTALGAQSIVPVPEGFEFASHDAPPGTQATIRSHAGQEAVFIVTQEAVPVAIEFTGPAGSQVHWTITQEDNTDQLNVLATRLEAVESKVQQLDQIQLATLQGDLRETVRVLGNATGSLASIPALVDAQRTSETAIKDHITQVVPPAPDLSVLEGDTSDLKASQAANAEAMQQQAAVMQEVRAWAIGAAITAALGVILSVVAIVIATRNKIPDYEHQEEPEPEVDADEEYEHQVQQAIAAHKDNQESQEAQAEHESVLAEDSAKDETEQAESKDSAASQPSEETEAVDSEESETSHESSQVEQEEALAVMHMALPEHIVAQAPKALAHRRRKMQKEGEERRKWEAEQQAKMHAAQARPA